MDEINNNKLSAKDVISKYLDLRALHPYLNEWDEIHLKDNPTRYYRMRQLKILFDVYSLGDFVAFEEGEFIKNRNLEEFNIIIEKANQFFKEYDLEHYDWHNIKKDDLYDISIIDVFNTLLSYRIKLETAFNNNAGVIECSGLYRYAHFLANSFNSYIKKEIYIIDDVLSLIISPSGKTFLVSELVSKYRFPDVDIDKIDAEWI